MRRLCRDWRLSGRAEYGDLACVNTEFWHLFRYPSVQAAFATLHDEVMIGKNTLDNVTKERDKFRSDIQVICVDINM